MSYEGQGTKVLGTLSAHAPHPFYTPLHEVDLDDPIEIRDRLIECLLNQLSDDLQLKGLEESAMHPLMALWHEQTRETCSRDDWRKHVKS